MIKGKIHKEDRHHKSLDTLTTNKKKIVKAKSKEV